jgi:hypothetical protein
MRQTSFRLNRPIGLLAGLAALAWRTGIAVMHEVPDSFPLIQSALDACLDGDTVLVAPGHYHERLLIPNVDLALGSNTLLTGDTLFISQTTIDGDSLGTVITAMDGGQNRFILDGFTIRGGVGYQDHGGGVHMMDSSDVTLRNLHFIQNTSTGGSGSCIYVSGITNPWRGTQRAELYHIRGWDNWSSSPILSKINVRAQHTAIFSDILFGFANSRIIFGSAYEDTCIARNIHVYSSVCNTAINIGMIDANEDSYLEYSNISVRNCQWGGNTLAHVDADAEAIISNITLEDNVYIGDRDWPSPMFGARFNGYALFDSLVFRRNRGTVMGSTGAELKLDRVLPQLPPLRGLVRNLILEDNVLGDSSYTDWNSTTNYPSMVSTAGFCYDGVVARNNTVILTPGPDSPIWGEKGANLIYAIANVMDSVYFRNMLFENNLVIDLDDNSETEGHWANEGRCLIIKTGNYFNSFQVENLIFDHNLQPNICEELPYGGEFDDGQDVGCVFLSGCTAVNFDHPTKCFSNLIFRGNQDGGMRSIRDLDLRLTNVQMIDMHRQALDLQADRVELDNVLIDGCEPFAAIPIRSEQMPLRLEVTDTSFVRNCTIINCTTPYVVMTGLREPDMSTDPIVHFENCLFANNQFDRFTALIPNYTDTPGWNPYIDGEFNYCLLPEAPVFGSNNLIGLDPMFDEVWGEPYLDPASPCIDAGNPDSDFNDSEDGENPGWARWPSHGGVRADIGVTGGPRAVAIDTNWVSVAGAKFSTTRPAALELGSPFPNPFNPVTRIPFKLHMPSGVRVRLYSLLGRLLVDEQLGTLPTGQHEYTLDAQNWATGVYLVEVLAGEQRYVKKVMLLR